MFMQVLKSRYVEQASQLEADLFDVFKFLII